MHNAKSVVTHLSSFLVRVKLDLHRYRHRHLHLHGRQVRGLLVHGRRHGLHLLHLVELHLVELHSLVRHPVLELSRPSRERKRTVTTARTRARSVEICLLVKYRIRDNLT